MDLSGKKIALLATNGFEDSELTQPMDAVTEAGAEVTVISDQADEITGENGTKVTVDTTVDEVSADDYDGLLIPGGVKNPDVMRQNDAAVSFVRDFLNNISQSRLFATALGSL